MKKLSAFVGVAATIVVAVVAFAVPASAQPENKLPAFADCGAAGTFNTFIANTNAFADQRVGATAINLDGPGAGVAFGQEGVGTFRGAKPYAERGVAKNLTSCDITVYTPAGPLYFAGVQVLLAGAAS